MKRMSSLISLVFRHVFSRNKFLVAFRQTRIWYASEKVHGWAGWYGLRDGGGLEVCGYGAGADKKFEPAQDPIAKTRQHKKT